MLSGTGYRFSSGLAHLRIWNSRSHTKRVTSDWAQRNGNIAPRISRLRLALKCSMCLQASRLEVHPWSLIIVFLRKKIIFSACFILDDVFHIYIPSSSFYFNRWLQPILSLLTFLLVFSHNFVTVLCTRTSLPIFFLLKDHSNTLTICT